MKPMKWFLSHYKKSIQFRLTFFFILSIVPLIVVSLYAVSNSKQIVIQQAGEQTRAAMLSSLGYIDQFIANAEQVSLLISSDRNMNEMLKIQGSEASMIYEASKVRSKLSNYKLANGSIYDLWILDENLDMLISKQNGGKRITYKDKAWYLQTIQRLGSPILHNPQKTDVHSNGIIDPVENANYITITRAMGFNSYEISKHVVGITIERSELLPFYKGLLTDPSFDFYLMGPDQQMIVSTTALQTLPFQIPHNDESYIIRTKSREDLLVTGVISQSSGWTMVLTQPESILNQSSESLQKFIYLLIALSFVLAMCISWIVYSGISAPVSNLLHGIRQIRRGKLDVQLKHNREDEFGFLTEAFNQMAVQQKQYIEDIYEQQVQKTRTELKFLQSQINPHFLYNTLDSIYASSVNYGAEEISEMVLCLSKFFRLSLSKGRNTFTVSETMEHLNYYIRIQQLRFMEHFTCEYLIAENCKSMTILRLILQPLVENAIIHGLEKSPPGGKLIISAELRQDLLILKISDTGAGISKQRLAQMHSEFAKIWSTAFISNDIQSDDFFGLKNVYSRLKLYYGERAELHITSREGEGTEVSVVIPTEEHSAIANEMKGEDEADEIDHRGGRNTPAV